MFLRYVYPVQCTNKRRDNSDGSKKKKEKTEPFRRRLFIHAFVVHS